MITTTLNRIREHHPCEEGWKKLLRHLGKTSADDEPLPFSIILESNGFDDALWCCRAELPAMIKQQAGVIVNVSSIATRGINRIPYSASKGGVNALTASLAFEHAKDGIRVNAVATGGTEAPPRKVPRNTNPLSQNEKDWMQQVVDQTKDRTFMGRYGTIQEQVNAILFLASDEASYMTGSVIPVGGGDQG